jgi:hypothetical protein
MASWREVYTLPPALERLPPEFYQGKLACRKKGSDKRIG